MNRLTRRTQILRGKRNGVFNPDQYYFENATRTRLARAARVHLRFSTPIVLVTPRWSRATGFLDDLAVDLSLGDPCITARSLSLAALKGLTAHQAWAWLASAVAEFCGIAFAEGPAWQAVSRRGFQTVMADLLARAEGGKRRLLMLHHVENLNVEALNDLIGVFRQHVRKFGRDRSFNFLFSGSVDAPHFDLQGAARIELEDFSSDEAIEVLVEHHGPIDEKRLRRVVAVVGGVPAVLDALGQGDEIALGQIVTNNEQLWKALGPLADEIRSALAIINADPKLSGRLEELARRGPQPEQPETDFALQRAGLVRRTATRSGARTCVRTPWFSDLALS